MEEYIKIPYPTFKFTDYVRKKAESYCISNLIEGIGGAGRHDIDKIERTLYEFHKDENKVQFIVYIITHLTEGLEKHLKTCKNQYCGAEAGTQDILYFLYGKLDEYGIETDIESFTKDELNNNDKLLNEIVDALHELKAGQDIIYTDFEQKLIENAISDVESAKGLQALGKQKWLKYIGGIVLEFSTNKILEGIFKAKVLPFFVKLGFGFTKLLE